MAQLLKSRTARVLGIVVLLVCIYALAGFVLAPRLLRSALAENIPKTLGFTPSVGSIRINPFLLQLELNDFSLPSPNGEKMLGFERLVVDFEFASLWRRALVFKDIEIGAPFVHVAVDADGSMNLLRLRPKSPESPVRADHGNQPLPRIQIGMFKVTKGLVTYADRSRKSAFSEQLEPIDFDLRDFSTGLDGGLFDFAGTTKRGERIEWHGHLGVQPLESDGEIKIIGLQARTIWEYMEDRLSFAISSGKIDVDA